MTSNENLPANEFVKEARLLAIIPISRRTLHTWRKKGKLPFVRVGTRSILYHLPSVRDALLREQTGGRA